MVVTNPKSLGDDSAELHLQSMVSGGHGLFWLACAASSGAARCTTAVRTDAIHARLLLLLLLLLLPLLP